SLIFMRASFPQKSGLKTAPGVLTLKEVRRRIVSRKCLYRRLGWFVIALVIFLAPAAVQQGLAQGRRLPRTNPETNSSQENKKAKKGKGKEPRAVAILQF